MLKISFRYTDQMKVTTSVRRRFRDEAKAVRLLARISSTTELVEVGLATLARYAAYRSMTKKGVVWIVG